MVEHLELKAANHPKEECGYLSGTADYMMNY